MAGQVQCLQQQGISVISDIDDTIKDSNVLDKKILLKKTFLKEFSSIKGMAKIYQNWQQRGYQFHYVSSSPWQLYPVLSDFLDEQSFPRGSMHLKLIRVKDSSIFNLLATPEEGKIPTITHLLETYPQRRFILVGDSGEKDPDIYATIARQYPDRIIKIYIHNVTADKNRIAAIFKELPRKQWVVFNDANEILDQHVLLNPVD
jgi:phosphatidate phosphatase APP1